MAAPGEGRIERRRAAIRAPAIGRREFITVFGAMFTAWPLAAFAQQTRAPIIGVLVHEPPGWPQFWQLFPEALRELGYVEGKNIRFEFRSDQGDLSRLPELA